VKHNVIFENLMLSGSNPGTKVQVCNTAYRKCPELANPHMGSRGGGCQREQGAIALEREARDSFVTMKIL
jgi:hypothetical protein